MILNFTDILAFDLIYEQEPDQSYKTNGANLVPRNLNDVIETIADAARQLYERIVISVKTDPGIMRYSEVLLYQVIVKYSRDLFGEARLRAKIHSLRHTITAEQIEFLSTFAEYGFKIDSCSPYIHRHVANLLYWLCVLKPFTFSPKDHDTAVELGALCNYHNEFVSYLLIQSMLNSFDLTLTLHRNPDMFKDFLYDLHYRNVSRSSMEFMLPKYIEAI